MPPLPEGRALPEGFPSALSDADLTETLDAMLNDFGETATAFRSMLPELRLAAINAGLQEKARRETTALAEITRQAASAADTASNRALLVALAALAVSVLSLVVSLIR
jgi:hypothetical protein